MEENRLQSFSRNDFGLFSKGSGRKARMIEDE